MSCIKDDSLQRYMDGESDKKEISHISRHVENCSFCRERLKINQTRADAIKSTLNRVIPEIVETPLFVISTVPSFKNSTPVRVLFFDLAAACIIFLTFFLLPKNAYQKSDDIFILPGFASDVDANRPASEQDMVMQIVDADGHVSEFFFK
jgi:hypothetical protein